jgi:hypothetical protein
MLINSYLKNHFCEQRETAETNTLSKLLLYRCKIQDDKSKLKKSYG